MSRKGGRHRLKVKQTISYAESSDSEVTDDESWLEFFARAFQHASRSGRSRRSTGSVKKRTTPKKSQKKTGPKKSNLTSNPPNITITVPLSASVNNVSITTSTNIDEDVLADQSKKVEAKVESFFKIHNLISDDEEGDNLVKKTNYPSKDTKEFYEIPDSDDDVKISSGNIISQPSTSYSISNFEAGSSNAHHKMSRPISTNIKSDDEVIELVENTSQKEDELMDVVDKILQTTETTSENAADYDAKWADYKNKAEEILNNVSNLLSEISTKPNITKPEVPQPESPKHVKPTCPICFDVLGGDVSAMATTCGHIFCKPCIQQVAKTVKKCPTCRSTVNQKKIHPIYL